MHFQFSFLHRQTGNETDGRRRIMSQELQASNKAGFKVGCRHVFTYLTMRQGSCERCDSLSLITVSPWGQPLVPNGPLLARPSLMAPFPSLFQSKSQQCAVHLIYQTAQGLSFVSDFLEQRYTPCVR